MTLYDVAKLEPDSYTYVNSTESCGTSWLDHLIVSDAETVTMIDIKYRFKFYDNIQLIFGINVNSIVENIKVPAVHYEFVLWDKITNKDIELYKENLRYFCMDLYNEALYCNNEKCNIEMYKKC